MFPLLSILSEAWPIEDMREVKDRGLKAVKSLLRAEENQGGGIRLGNVTLTFDSTALRQEVTSPSFEWAMKILHFPRLNSSDGLSLLQA